MNPMNPMNPMNLMNPKFRNLLEWALIGAVAAAIWTAIPYPPAATHAETANTSTQTVPA